MSFGQRFNNVKFYAASFDAELAELDSKLQALKTILKEIDSTNNSPNPNYNIIWHSIDSNIKNGLRIIEELTK